MTAVRYTQEKTARAFKLVTSALLLLLGFVAVFFLSGPRPGSGNSVLPYAHAEVPACGGDGGAPAGDGACAGASCDSCASGSDCK